MIFARRVFQIAGIYGLIVVTLAYAAHLAGVEQAVVYSDHPELVHGFFLVTLAWQVAFLLIATDPVRFRVLMLAAMLEKFPFTIVVLLFYAGGYVDTIRLDLGLIDGLIGILFSIAYVLTDREARAEAE